MTSQTGMEISNDSILATRLPDTFVADLFLNAHTQSVQQAEKLLGDEAADPVKKYHVLTAIEEGFEINKKDVTHSILILEKMSQRRKQPFSFRQRLQLAFAAVARPRSRYLDDIFGRGKDRLYFPLETSDPVDESTNIAFKTVRCYLQERGYTITDYAEGYATDAKGKQTFRIGKLLKDVPDIQKKFMEDATRTKQKMLVVLSRRPDDIARMSTERSWGSCMSQDGWNFEYVKRDIRQQSLIAYLVRENDPDIKRPLARILLKSYDSVDRQVPKQKIWRAAHSYGLKYPAFEKMVKSLTAAINPLNTRSAYRLAKGTYSDGGPTVIFNIPVLEKLSAEEFLDAVGVAWKKKNGKIFVGTLRLKSLGLTNLPDLSKVVVTGYVDLRGNKLTSLKGVPEQIFASKSEDYSDVIFCEDNPLTAEGIRALPKNFLYKVVLTLSDVVDAGTVETYIAKKFPQPTPPSPSAPEAMK